MLNKLLSTIGLAAKPQQASSPAAPERPSVRVGAPIYPPVDRGVAFLDAEELIASQSELISRLRLAAGCDDTTFERLYGSVIRNVADAINLLPATESGAHNGAGGLFRLSLEIAFFAFQASEATIFAARAGVEQRRELEPRWRYATFLAGLCSELYRPITQMLVSTPDGRLWPAYQVGLGDWLREQGTDHFLVRWVTAAPGTQRPGQGATSYLAHRIIPTTSLQYLHEGSIEIAPTLFDCIAGVRAGQFEASPLQKIVSSVRDKVIARDEALKPQRYGKLRVGTHLEPHLLDAMRRLATNGTWVINAKKARLWYSQEGLFLVWKTAAKEIIELLQKDGTTGVPQDPQTLVELLTNAQVFEVDGAGSPYVMIRPPESANDLIAVKFANPLALLGALAEEPEPVTSVLGNTAPASTTATTADAPSEPATTDAPPTTSPPPVPPAASAPAAAQAATGDAPPTPAQPAVKPPAPAAAPNRNDERDVGANVPDALGKAVTPLCRDVIGALIDDLRSQGQKVQAGKHPLGFAIGIEQVAGYGVDVTRFVEEVNRLGWLVPHPEKTSRKFHDAQLGNKLVRAIVIKLPIATDLGLTTP
jgi:conjugal transfer pilus assembly protein TraI